MSNMVKRIRNLTEVALLDDIQTAQLQEMIELAYIGNKPDREFILQNADAYSGLNSKAILTVISGNLPKDSVQKAVGIVALLRKEGLNDKADLLSVLGSVKRTQPKSKADESWEKAVQEEPKKDVTPKAEEKATANTEQTHDGESLVDVIKAMEAETSNPTVIKEALFALKFANKEFFEQQTPTLSKEMRKKYASVLDR